MMDPLSFLVGATIALLGVLVGRDTERRAQRERRRPDPTRKDT